MSRVRSIRATVLVTHADGTSALEEVDLLRDPGDPMTDAPPAMGVRIIAGALEGTTIMIADAWLSEVRRLAGASA